MRKNNKRIWSQLACLHAGIGHVKAAEGEQHTSQDVRHGGVRSQVGCAQPRQISVLHMLWRAGQPVLWLLPERDGYKSMLRRCSSRCTVGPKADLQAPSNFCDVRCEEQN